MARGKPATNTPAAGAATDSGSARWRPRAAEAQPPPRRYLRLPCAGRALATPYRWAPCPVAGAIDLGPCELPGAQRGGETPSAVNRVVRAGGDWPHRRCRPCKYSVKGKLGGCVTERRASAAAGLAVASGGDAKATDLDAAHRSTGIDGDRGGRLRGRRAWPG
eukprot:1015204-Prymnesium_polylepis.1